MIFAAALPAQDTTLAWFRNDSTCRGENGFHGAAVVTRPGDPPGVHGSTTASQTTAGRLRLSYARDTFEVRQLRGSRPGRINNDWYYDTIHYRIPRSLDSMSCMRRFWTYRGDRNLDTLGEAFSGILASELTTGSDWALRSDTATLYYAAQKQFTYTGKKRRWPQVRNTEHEGLPFIVYKFLPANTKRITALYWAPEFGVIRVESPNMKQAYELIPCHDDQENIVSELNAWIYYDKRF